VSFGATAVWLGIGASFGSRHAGCQKEAATWAAEGLRNADSIDWRQPDAARL